MGDEKEKDKLPTLPPPLDNCDTDTALLDTVVKALEESVEVDADGKSIAIKIAL
jgi:hypothetical protein